jgi:hypothetical protein
MRKFGRRVPSPAFVISVIALFVALGGTTYAAATSLPVNSVGTPQLKNLAVTGPKIANAAVTAAKINTTGLTVPNSSAVGGLSAAQLQRAISGSCSAGSAIRAVASDGTVTCQATPAADGPAIAFGNVQLNGSGCEVAAASGLSTSGGCVLGVAETVEVPLPVDRVLSNLRARIPATVATDVYVSISSTNNSGYSTEINCTIPAGGLTCANTGSTGTISAGTYLVLYAQTTSSTRLSFGYEMGAP